MFQNTNMNRGNETKNSITPQQRGEMVLYVSMCGFNSRALCACRFVRAHAQICACARTFQFCLIEEIKQGGHTGVDDWPWPGGHSMQSSPTLFMVGY